MGSVQNKDAQSTESVIWWAATVSVELLETPLSGKLQYAAILGAGNPLTPGESETRAETLAKEDYDNAASSQLMETRWTRLVSRMGAC